MTATSSPPSAERAIARALGGLGVAVPVLAGGNVLLLLGPEEAIRYLGVAVVGFAALLAATSRLRAAADPLPLGLLLILVLWWAGTFFLRPSAGHASTELIGLLCAALLYTVLVATPLPAAGLRAYAVGLVAGGLVTAAYGQYQYWVVLPRIAPMMQAMTGSSPFLVVNGNFYNANCYASTLAALVLLAVAAFQERGPRGSRLFALGSLPPLLVTLWLTGSRATFLLLLAVFIVRIATRGGAVVFRGRRAGVVGALVLAFAAGTAASLHPEELWRVATLGRVAIWEGAARMIADHWLLGVGLGRFAEYFYDYQVTDYYTRYPHNLLLEVWAETGIVGFLALVGFLAAAFARATAWQRSGGGSGPLAAYALAAAALLAAHALVDIDWHAPANPVLLFSLLAIRQRGGEEAGE